MGGRKGQGLSTPSSFFRYLSNTSTHTSNPTDFLVYKEKRVEDVGGAEGEREGEEVTDETSDMFIEKFSF